MSGTIEHEWLLSLDDNYVLIVNNKMVAAVHRPSEFYGWGIVISRDGVTYIVMGEFYPDLAEAQARAEAIWKGAPCLHLNPLKMQY